MLKCILLFILSFSMLCADSQNIIINNRILTTINGKTLSMLDVVKQMDVYLNQYYPQYLDSEPAKVQFYKTQWKSTLQRMIDQELMMADAESRQVKASDAEVREEIQNRYGPNVMASLDKLGLSYEETKKMVYQDIVVQKIQWLRVTSKVLPKVTTEVVKKAYDEYQSKNPPKEIWTYQFLTLRYDETEQALTVAKDIHQLKEASLGALSKAFELLKQKLSDSEQAHLSLSPELQAEEKELSSSHKDVLAKMDPNTWSTPLVQKSRDGTSVVRIFHLMNHTKQETALFETMATGLRQELLNHYADKEMTAYISKLHERFNYSPSSLDIPPQFEPFSF